MRRSILAVCLVLGVLATACGGDDDDSASPAPTGAEDTGTTESTTTTEPKPEESAADALERQVERLFNGQYRRVYEEIHPAQRELFSADIYEECTSEGLGGTGFVSFDEVESYEEEIPIPGTDITAMSTAVTAELTYTYLGEELTDTDTFHEVLVDGRWYFTVTAAESLAEGLCE